MKKPGMAIPAFLTGGGEMGDLIRSFNWASTPVGDFNRWPQSLSTTISILLHTKFPMFLWWGPELICFYNDAYRPSLGENGKHPSILGTPAKDAWPEIWHVIKPLIDQVLSGGEAVWFENQLVPIYRNGKIEDVYWTFSYSPVMNEQGEVGGVLVVCNETTENINTLQKSEEAKAQLSFAIDAAELDAWELNPHTHKFTGNNRLKDWFGLQPDDEIELQLALNAVVEKDRQRVANAIQTALQFSSGGVYEVEYTIINAHTGQQRMVKAKGKALFDDEQNPYRFNGTLQDITAEVLAGEQRQKLLTLVDNSVDLMAILELNGKNSYINKAGMDILGIPAAADVTQIPIADFHTPEQLAFVESEILPNTMTKGRWAGQFAIRNGKTGEIIPLYNNCHRIDDVRTGEPIGVGAVMRDMRPELNARKEIAENEERLNIAMQATGLGMWELNMQTDELIYNSRYLEILGFPENEIPLHADIMKHLHPDDVTERNRAVQLATETGLLNLEIRIIHPDNSIHWIKGRGKIFYDENNEPVKQLGTIMDITEQKNAEEAYKLSIERFRLLADSMPQFIWTGDAAGNLDYYNQAVYNYSGLTPQEVTAGGWIQIVHPEDRDENIAAWIEAVTSGTDFLFEHRFRRFDGEYRWQLSRALPQRDSAGIIQMWVGTSTDIHEQKTMARELERKVNERTKELQAANDELEKKNKELASFAYVSSHDLQEPLRKIHTFISRIEDSDGDSLSARGKDYFERMKLSATRMQGLINDLLSFSRTNTAEKEFVNTDINLLLEEVIKDLQENIQKSNAVIQVSEMPALTVIVFQFYQLFTNLISNAIKFAKKDVPPHVTITGRQIGGGGIAGFDVATTREYFNIKVSDNGIGFAPEYSTRIFEVFQRLHGKNEYEGTGIGLAICKKIVENHHGFITAESVPGQGAVFNIYIPHKP